MTQKRTRTIKEVWKAIPGLDGYEASNLGRVRSVKIHILTPQRMWKVDRGETYMKLNIKNRKYLVHRLVAAAFMADLAGKLIHHKNNDKTDNRLSNLQAVTAEENTRFAYADGRVGSHFKLNPFQRRKVMEGYKAGKSPKELAAQFGVNAQSIRYILRGVGIKHPHLRKLKHTDIPKILRLLDRGVLSKREIGEKFGVTEGSILNVQRKYHDPEREKQY